MSRPPASPGRPPAAPAIPATSPAAATGRPPTQLLRPPRPLLRCTACAQGLGEGRGGAAPRNRPPPAAPQLPPWGSGCRRPRRRPARTMRAPPARGPCGHHEPLAPPPAARGAPAAGPSPVVSWIDVYARATCQPREVVVPLTLELVGTMAKQLVPSCVTVQRCGGCCPDDGLECVPTGQHQVRMQILMVRYPSSQLGEMSLEEHSQCECRPKKKESAVKPDSPRPLCPRCTQRRQRPDPRTCHCRCRRRSFHRCQGRGLELNPDTCRCRKPRK